MSQKWLNAKIFAFNHPGQTIFMQNVKLDANIFAFSFPLLIY
ncbi:hypothetical protein EVA_00860 [gut metagenome]|uniref:Uncharacterized protein n=1 Tax=gut metagenome TaxID=749906 RepID=J9GQL3_9ZZZZ